MIRGAAQNKAIQEHAISVQGWRNTMALDSQAFLQTLVLRGIRSSEQGHRQGAKNAALRPAFGVTGITSCSD